MPTIQLRHDFEINDIGLALKYSEHWGYHLELDRVVQSQAEVTSALQDIEKFAQKIGLELLSEGAEQKYVAAMLKKLQ